MQFTACKLAMNIHIQATLTFLPARSSCCAAKSARARHLQRPLRVLLSRAGQRSCARARAGQRESNVWLISVNGTRQQRSYVKTCSAEDLDVLILCQ